MPHVTVKLHAGRSERQKARIAEEVTKAILAGANCGEDPVSVSLEEVEPRNWVKKVYKTDALGKTNTLYEKP